MKALWVSCPGCTVRVVVDDRNRLIEVAPIVRAFRGQELSRMLRWMERCWNTIPTVELL